MQRETAEMKPAATSTADAQTLDRSHDQEFMARALELAARGRGLASPNPMVGAVLVRDCKVIAEGFHTYDGLRHAPARSR
jgi:pyrimidine deaminase RibD-like protein